MQREIDLRETARELASDRKHHDEQRKLNEQLGAALAAAEAALEQRRKDVLAATQQVATIQADLETCLARWAISSGAFKVRKLAPWKRKRATNTKPPNNA